MVAVVKQMMPIGHDWNDSAATPSERYLACKAMARGYAELRKTEKARLVYSRAFCSIAIYSFWSTVCARHACRLAIKDVPLYLPQPTAEVRKVAEAAGRLIADFPIEDAGYLIGSIYTVMLPPSLRSAMGAFYTPPSLVARLLDLAEAAGFDFANGTALDPACGGGAFLAPLALRMIAARKNESPGWVMRTLGKRLKGFELDPFAAWMTSVLLEAAVLPLCIITKRRMVDVVEVGDALRPRELRQFDLVIGNPPYGRITLDVPLREHYTRSLYGHANLYGLFTDLALRLIKPKGVLAYLTPTSFLGGQYFKKLRQLLTDQMRPVAFDFVADREGVFDDVLQETLLTAYVKESLALPATVSVIVPQGLNAIRVEPAGSVHIDRKGNPWLLPRHAGDAAFLDVIRQMPTRLRDLGYVVTTGQLVWNRHKVQLRTAARSCNLPLIWAESVTSAGFVFSADRRNHVPYIRVYQDQPHLITRCASVLVQRTTSKEQDRRLLAAVLPQSFLDRHGGAVVENHLNLIHTPVGLAPKIGVETVAALLNTAAVDRAFRCISGSVAVSAYELNALPLPSVEQLTELECVIARGAANSLIERKVATFYGAT